MGADPVVERCEPLAPLQVQGGAELGLSAGPLQEHHQPPGHREGDVATEVLLDHRQGQIDPGGDAGRGPESRRR